MLTLVKAALALMFIYVLPVFNNMGAIARLIVIFFYVAILFAGVSSVINLLEVPINFLQEQFKLKRWIPTVIIHVVALVVALLIQPWTSDWMDMVSIYVLPLGAITAGIMFFWVMKKETAIAAAQEGSDKPIMKWFIPSASTYSFRCAPSASSWVLLGAASADIVKKSGHRLSFPTANGPVACCRRRAFHVILKKIGMNFGN